MYWWVPFWKWKNRDKNNHLVQVKMIETITGLKWSKWGKLLRLPQYLDFWFDI